MAYTEAELIGQLEKDLARPGELYVKDYIQEGGVASDTGRSYEDIISTYLVSHAEALKMTDTNWGMVHTAIGKTSERGSRMAQKLLLEKDFFHAIPLDGDVRLTDGTMAEVGYFDFMTLDKEGKSLTLFEIRTYPEKEKPLSRLLRCWSLKTSLNKALLLQMLGMEKLPRISIVTLITGGGSDHFTPAGRQPVPLPLKQLGGMLRYGIPSFKLEKDVIDAEIDIIKAMGVEIKCGIEVGKDVTLDELRAQGYKAFYIAIGCQGGRKAGIPGEDAEGVMTAVDFLRTVGADESYPVTGKAVVVGGGNVAIDVARTAQRCGAESVAMFCLEPRDKMPASEEEIAEALEEDVTIDCGWGPKEILTENGRVTGIVFKRCVSVWDKDGKFAPAYDENDTKTVPCDRVFLSIGQSILKGSKVELGRGNGAVADSLTYQTAEPDIFVGGDVYTGPKFAIDAIAAGREGAISIHRFVQPHSSLTIGRNRREFIALDKDNIKVEQYDNASRQIPGTRKDVDHKKSFRDAKLPFTEEQVKAETARCLGCGASVVDPNKCIGCGVCTTKCEFGAIKLHRERPECSNMIPSEKKLPYVLGNGAKQALKIKFSKKKEQ